MVMSRSHGVASIVIGVLELILGVALIIFVFVFSTYGTSQSQPYWGGFPVSKERALSQQT